MQKKKEKKINKVLILFNTVTIKDAFLNPAQD